jgi:hypothetical protein
MTSWSSQRSRTRTHPTTGTNVGDRGNLNFVQDSLTRTGTNTEGFAKMTTRDLDSFSESLDALPPRGQVVAEHLIDALDDIIQPDQFVDADRLIGMGMKAVRLGYLDLIPHVTKWISDGKEEARLDVGFLVLYGILKTRQDALSIDILNTVDVVISTYKRPVNAAFDTVHSEHAEVTSSPNVTFPIQKFARGAFQSILTRERTRWPAQELTELENLTP